MDEMEGQVCVYVWIKRKVKKANEQVLGIIMCEWKEEKTYRIIKTMPTGKRIGLI